MFPEVVDAHPLALAGVDAYALDRRNDHRGWESSAPHQSATSGPGGARRILVVRSHRGVLRGAYAHPCADAQLSLVEGSAMLGLHDLRPASPTYGRSLTVDLGDRHEFAAVLLPAGVAYAIWCTTSTVHALSSDHALDPVDEYACRWDDPGLGFAWHPDDPMLSVRDALAGSLNAMRTSVAAAIG
jgi:dTDP-4-dehydrorhamnose 3,5-epimerase